VVVGFVVVEVGVGDVAVVGVEVVVGFVVVEVGVGGDVHGFMSG